MQKSQLREGLDCRDGHVLIKTWKNLRHYKRKGMIEAGKGMFECCVMIINQTGREHYCKIATCDSWFDARLKVN